MIRWLICTLVPARFNTLKQYINAGCRFFQTVPLFIIGMLNSYEAQVAAIWQKRT